MNLPALPPALRASVALHALALGTALAAPSHWRLALAAIAANHGALALAGLNPRDTLLGPNLIRLPRAAARRGEVGLTFDDGPDPAVTPRVLDLLARAGAGASFFCIGERAARHPHLIRAILADGHSVENHTMTHDFGFALRGPAGLRREIADADAALWLAGQAKPAFFRAPAGIRSPLLGLALARTGHRYAGWTRRGLDGIDTSPQRVLSRLLDGLRAGDILLLHDGGQRRDVLLCVLPLLLASLRARGLTGVSLPQALARRDAFVLAPDRRVA